MLSKEDTEKNGIYPVYSSESTSGGIIGYTRKPEFICNSATPIFITFGDHTRTFNIAQTSFSVLDNVKVLLPCTNSIKSILFMTTVWHKQIPNLGYSRHWKVAKKCTLSLPQTTTGKIDFAFMEDFVRELEELRLRELEAYLLATGLSNYELSPKEQTAINRLPFQKWKEYDVTKVFKVCNTHNILSSEIKPDSGTIPYLCASSENNGVSTYISHDKRLIEKGNCVFIGGKTFVVSYQKTDFFSNDSHNLALYLMNNTPTKANQLYLACCIAKSLGHKYSWGDSISNAKIKRDKITLPVKRGKPDFETMETLISAVQKLVIKDVVLYADRRLAATKQVIAK